MPHVIIEYSANIHDAVQAARISAHAHEALIHSGFFSTADIKTRAYPAQDYLVGDKGTDGSFIHVSVYIMEGRPIEKKQVLSEALRDMIAAKLPQVDQISVDVRELMRDVYRKHRPVA